jgi:redox-sensing transcriptional repressor
VIPQSVIKRLTKYLTFVQGLRAEGVDWVSSQDMADALGLTSSTVRQDLSHIDFHGISKRGYETCGFHKVLAKVLGADTVWNMIVIGAGNLGKALALHEEFPRRGYNVCGIFDNDPRKTGRKVGRFTVQHIRDMPRLIKEGNIDVGVIAVPASAAQSVADMLIISRVRGILNMTLTHIVAPKHIVVIDSRIVASLFELSHAITAGR